MAEAPARSSQSDAVRWHLGLRILFRFAFCYIVLYYLTSVLAVIPGAAWIALFYRKLWNEVAGWIAAHLLYIDVATLDHPSGSGDTAFNYIQQAIILVLAACGGVLWTIFGRRRPQYVYLHGWLRVLGRYALSFALFSYAFAKILPTQFSHLQVLQLNETYGQSSPMRLLWNFIGFSTAYTIFCGLAELIPA